jgi:hypothetical protein
VSWTFVQHVHTRHSFDSLADPAALVRRAQAVGIEVLGITDHDTWRGARAARAAARSEGRPVHVVIGTEVRTGHGDLIGLFLERDVTERDALAFCDAVHAQGGLVVLPHPFKWHRLDDALLAHVDLVEVHNARCSRFDNARAEALAMERNLATVVGPDAHRTGELLLARNEFDGDPPRDEATIKHALLHAPRRFYTQPGSIWNEWLSQAVKLTREPSAALAWGLARGAVRRLVKPGAYRNA